MGINPYESTDTYFERMAREFAAAGLDVDTSFLEPFPDDGPLASPGRIRVKERDDTSTWDSQAKCQYAPDPRIFFPTRHSTPEQIAEGKKFCEDCPVRWDCLAYSTLNWEKFGIWGGYTEIERREIRRAVRSAVTEGSLLDADDPEQTSSVREWLEGLLGDGSRRVRRGHVPTRS